MQIVHLQILHVICLCCLHVMLTFLPVTNESNPVFYELTFGVASISSQVSWTSSVEVRDLDASRHTLKNKQMTV